MELHILKENLQTAVSLVARFSTNKAQLPILSHLGFKTDGKEVYCLGTDMQVGAKVRVGAKLVKPGAIAVPAKILQNLVSTLPLGSVQVESDGQQIILRTGRSKIALQGMSMQEFPEIDSQDAQELCELRLDKDVVEVIERLSFSLSHDTTRPILTGLYWHLASGLLVSTDGFRLSLYDKVWVVAKTKLDQDTLLIDGSILGLMVKVFQDLKASTIKVLYKASTKQIFFQNEDAVLMGRVLQGEYPPFQAIVPAKSLITLEAEVEQLIQAVKTAVVMAQEAGNIIYLKLAEGQLEVGARSAQVGYNQVKLDVQGGKSQELEVAFNGRYVLDCLQHLQGSSVQIELTEPLKPVVFSDPSNTNYKHIIMPVKTQASA